VKRNPPRRRKKKDKTQKGGALLTKKRKGVLEMGVPIPCNITEGKAIKNSEERVEKAGDEETAKGQGAGILG